MLADLALLASLACLPSAPLDPAGRWDLTMTREGMIPAVCGGTLHLEHEAAAWSGRMRFRTILFAQDWPLSDVEVEGERVAFRVVAGELELSFEGRLAAEELAGSCTWKDLGEYPWTARRAPPQAPFEDDSAEHAWCERAEPKAAGVDPLALEELLSAAAASETAALVVLKDGRLVCERRFGQPRGAIEAMSATKSVVALAVGLLLDRELLPSLDVPVCSLLPEWAEDARRAVTVRHLLTHASGLQADRTTERIYASEDFVAFALEAELATPPGDVFFYNNRATNLLAGVVEAASGQRMDEFLRGALFEPLGIESFTWSLDAAGNPHAMSGLQIDALDLARIGELVRLRGEWKGERLISSAFLDEMLRPCVVGRMPQEYGLLWWLTPSTREMWVDGPLFEAWGTAGADEEFLTCAVSLLDRRLPRSEFWREVLLAFAAPGEEPDFEAMDPPAMMSWMRNTRDRGQLPYHLALGPPQAVSARGYLGQYLVVVPDHGLVAVRQRRYPAEGGELDPTANFASFEQLVLELVAGG